MHVLIAYPAITALMVFLWAHGCIKGHLWGDSTHLTAVPSRGTILIMAQTGPLRLLIIIQDFLPSFCGKVSLETSGLACIVMPQRTCIAVESLTGEAQFLRGIGRYSLMTYGTGEGR